MSAAIEPATSADHGVDAEPAQNEMERRRLGVSGLEVSVFSMGTMTFGDEADEAESHAMLDRFVEAGGTLIDTADAYAQGRSEQYIGRWLGSRTDLDHLVIATKAFFATGDRSDRPGRGSSPPHPGFGCKHAPAGGRGDRPVPDPLLGLVRATR